MKKNQLFINWKHTLKISVTFLMLFFVTSIIQAQNTTVNGTVVDQSGVPLPGANILEKGTSNGVTADFDGKFSINLKKPDAVLTVSYIGFSTLQVTAKGNSSLKVVMQENAAGLDEVVVVGYGTQKKSDLTGSVGSISSKDLLKAPIVKIGAGLQGKISGVNIQQTTGAPGQKMKIRIRGGSSINYGNEPLYVIDGFIGADISTINPNDIATINFLKDASATAVYGSRGANGVVLITTVAPKEGPLKVTFDTNIAMSSMVNQYDILPIDEMAELMNEQQASLDKPAFFSPADIAGFRSRGGTDWVDLITRQGYRQNYSLNLTGGSEKLKYFFSANHLNDEGVIKNSFYRRTSIRSNISGNIGERIQFKFNTYGTHIESQANGRGTGGTGNPIGNAVIFPQMWASRDANGEFIDGTTYNSYNGAFLVGRLVNPEMQVRQNQENLNDKITSNIDLNIDLANHLTLSLSAAGSLSMNYRGQRTLPDFININRDNVTAQQAYNRGNSWLANSILTYENDFGEHNLKISGVYEFSKSVNRNNTATVGSLSTLANEWHLLANGTPSSINSGYGTGKLRSYMGRLNYSFKDRYLLTASMRADGSSRFNSDNRWGYFPSAAFAWRASEENFIQNSSWLSNLKFRVGFGAVGNQAVGYGTIQQTFAASDSGDGRNYGWYQLDNGESVQGVVPGSITDNNLKWETTTSYNAGIDFGILDNKLSGTVDVYSKKATDVIIAKSIPRYTGQSAITDNFADIDNNGVEIGLNWNIMNKDDFQWTAYANFTKNKNIIQDLGESGGEPVEEIFIANEEPIGIWSLVGGNNKFIVRKGESMGALFGLKATGIWQENEAAEADSYNSRPGEVKYEDVDGDGVISAEDRQIIGSAAPDFTYGLGTSMAYKGFDLSIQCIGSVGNDIYNWTDNRLNYGILSTDYRDRWSPTNTSSTQQVMPYGTDYSLTYVVSQYVEKGSFFKISNMTLGYNIPDNTTDALGISSLRLYASADNVLTITDYSGLDPEGSSTALSSDSQSGIDAFSYPLTRTISLGLKVSF
ncbi:TonB-dependent receptor [Zobellia sp. 1_MG-2023]|uniref:SusC/RagA family TonB-linked outer membrane protein n=1 Tax=Zobellia sp. 1_MG-2023 TaxID=3062626 RepID=UPI0026E272C6|nr:TonB-dependent receptor [Zobellia sp. 1_MG-2023]MDO6818499.1 TonB-dependent receptor [Zobellia sp. 1_MG-2023]